MSDFCGRCGHPGEHATESDDDAGIPERCTDCPDCQAELDDTLARQEAPDMADADFVAHALSLLRPAE